MITPIFFNITVIVGVHPTGMDFDPAKVTRMDHSFSFSIPTYNSFIEDNLNETHDIYSAEYIVFLTYWFQGMYFVLNLFRWLKNTCPLEPIFIKAGKYVWAH